MTFTFPAIDTTDRDDGKVIYWDDGDQVHKYKDEASSGGMALIETGTPAGDPAIITFTSIPSTYKDLLFIGRLRCDDASSHRNSVRVRMGNGSLDTGTNYAYFMTSRVGSGSQGQDADDNDTSGLWLRGAMPGSGSTAGMFGTIWLWVYDYTNTTYFKNVISQYVNVPNGTSGEIGAGYGGGCWRSTSAVDTVSFYDEGADDLVTGSEIRMYGVG